MSLIHRYKSNGFNIVLDINSGCIHLVDDVTYEVLPYLEEGLSSDAIVEKLGGQYKKEDIETSVKECNKLKEYGMLFTRDVYENAIEEFSNNRQTLSALIIFLQRESIYSAFTVQIFIGISASSYQGRNIIHIADIGIYILIQLPDNCLCIHNGVLINGGIGISQRNNSHCQHCT